MYQFFLLHLTQLYNIYGRYYQQCNIPLPTRARHPLQLVGLMIFFNKWGTVYSSHCEQPRGLLVMFFYSIQHVMLCHFISQTQISQNLRCYKIFIIFLLRADYRTISGHQGHRLDDNSFKGVVAMFAHLVIGMFRYLDSHHSSQLLKLFPVSKRKILESY